MTKKNLEEIDASLEDDEFFRKNMPEEVKRAYQILADDEYFDRKWKETNQRIYELAQKYIYDDGRLILRDKIRPL